MIDPKEEIKVFSFRAQNKLIDAVCEKIDKENRKKKNRKDKTNMSRKINELLYDYISR